MTRALIIEDEQNICDSIQAILSEELQIDSDLAYNGEEGVAYIKKVSYDFICLDFKMPKMDGIEFIRELRTVPNRNQYVPIILISGFNPDVISVRDIMGKMFFLEKPINLDKFLFYVQISMQKAS